jgi:hypothetical protein
MNYEQQTSKNWKETSTDITQNTVLKFGWRTWNHNTRLLSEQAMSGPDLNMGPVQHEIGVLTVQQPCF